ncbi:MAG: hypothetical protein NT169_06045 [Chloroflexi bacterium]|nr:hypothetical protein [Chloroflexota bacterium]
MLGTYLTFLIGPTIAVPAPPSLLESLKRVEVTHDDEQASGFQLTFQVGRVGAADLLDYALLANPLLKPFNRVILIITFNAMPRVLMDGIITHQQLSPSNEPGASTLTITGEDVSVMMDLKGGEPVEHPAQPEPIIALKLIASYAQYGLIPMVIPPPVIDPPIPIQRIPVQHGTDLAYLRQMASRYGYVFYVKPGPAPFTNTAYWGPPVRVGLPQPALSVALGGQTNVNQVNFRNNAMGPTLVEGRVQDSLTGQALPVQTFASLRPPLSVFPAWLFNQPNVRRVQFQETGVNAVAAMGRAQGRTDASTDSVVAEGELDTMQYGNLLEARGLVGMRGVGYSYDGLWYVKRVRHVIEKEKYTQSFTVTREGLGSTVPVVVP